LTRSEIDAFQLSRVYGEGWNAAKKLISEGRAAGDVQSTQLNPYRSEEERVRWADGFKQGRISRTNSRTLARSRGWRR
jgi:ribosome modulation factor